METVMYILAAICLLGQIFMVISCFVKYGIEAGLGWVNALIFLIALLATV